MIKNNEALSMAEAEKYIDKNSEIKKELTGFIKKFVKMKPEKAKELKEKLVGLDLIKINEKHICKLIDFLPENEEDVNKVLVNANLNEDETKRVLETIKEFK